ncbi:MAG: amidohydrolase family protein [Angelakisella sp.]|nr:amidohydrolase family protein [Angelakisella sp.]
MNHLKGPIADAHAHIFPQKIAQKAVGSIGSFYNIPMCHEGVAHALVESGNRIGVQKYLVCSTATTPSQVISINDFIYEKCSQYSEFVGFATLHPNFEDLEAEVERIASMGLYGVKLHPDFQKFEIDAPHAIPLYRACAKAKLPILFHTGDDRYDFSAPHRLYNALEQVPDLVCIAAHFGGYQNWDEAYHWLKHPNVWFDTSSSLFSLSMEEAMKMMEHLGFDRFMFGSDFPMWDHVEELERFNRLPLTSAQRKKVLWENFHHLLHLPL